MKSLPLLLLSLLSLLGCSDEPVSSDSSAALPVARKKIRDAKLPRAKQKKDLQPDKPAIGIADDLPDASAALMKDVNVALEKEDTKSALDLFDRVKAEESPDVREAYLKTLGWIGPEALPEITQFLADKDENVMTEAGAQWLDCLYRIESEKDKLDVIRFALLEIDNEYVTTYAAEELASLPKNEALSVVLDGLTSERAVGREAAQSAYEAIVGEKFTTAAAAAKEIAAALED